MNWYHDILFGLFDNITCLQHLPLRCDTMKNEENCRKRSISNSLYTKRIDNRYSNEFTIKASTLISFIISTKTRSQETPSFGCDSNQNLSIISQKLSNNFLSSRQWRQKTLANRKTNLHKTRSHNHRFISHGRNHSRDCRHRRHGNKHEKRESSSSAFTRSRFNHSIPS